MLDVACRLPFGFRRGGAFSVSASLQFGQAPDFGGYVGRWLIAVPPCGGHFVEQQSVARFKGSFERRPIGTNGFGCFAGVVVERKSVIEVETVIGSVQSAQILAECAWMKPGRVVAEPIVEEVGRRIPRRRKCGSLTER